MQLSGHKRGLARRPRVLCLLIRQRAIIAIIGARRPRTKKVFTWAKTTRSKFALLRKRIMRPVCLNLPKRKKLCLSEFKYAAIRVNYWDHGFFPWFMKTCLMLEKSWWSLMFCQTTSMLDAGSLKSMQVIRIRLDHIRCSRAVACGCARNPKCLSPMH